MSRRIHVRRCVSTRPALPDGLRDMWSGKGIAVLSRAMRRDRELRKNRRQKQRYVLLRASSASSNAFNSAQCLVCLTIIALRRSVSLSSYSRSSRACIIARANIARGQSACRPPMVFRLIGYCVRRKHLFRGFYFDELSGQSRNSGVEAFLLRKVVLKEFTHMNCRDE